MHDKRTTIDISTNQNAVFELIFCLSWTSRPLANNSVSRQLAVLMSVTQRFRGISQLNPSLKNNFSIHGVYFNQNFNPKLLCHGKVALTKIDAPQERFAQKTSEEV